MMFKKLNRTDLNVSRLCFGTMTLGKPADQQTSTRMIDQCIEAGINFFDTANMYQLGIAETMLGEALKGKRKNQIVASKVRFKMGEGSDQSGLSKQAILRAIEESLKRMQTDYLDIYYLHYPDYNIPIEQTLETLELLVKQGKIRYPATSNYAAWQQTEMLWIAEKKNYRPAVITQSMYNLLARGIEQEWLPMTEHFGLSNIVYNPLAAGLLTGKHQMQTITPGTRFDNNKLYQDRYWHQQDFAAVEKLKKLTQRSGRSLISIAFNWLLHHTPTDCVILGASRPEQLAQNLAACKEGPLPNEVVKACDEIWKELRGPIPVYNR
ncbi:MAG TPA: aldo/keto reductase [Terriglobales bacterium]|nr:aldo/keto reductase [Terriglobales bacterium]